MKGAGWLRFIYGFLGGFTTLVANNGGPAMSMYLILSEAKVKQHLVIITIFFFVVNIINPPFIYELGLFTPEVITNYWKGLPLLIVGALLGFLIAPEFGIRRGIKFAYKSNNSYI